MAEAAAQERKSTLARITELAWQAVPAIASAIGFAGFVAVVGGAIEWVRFWSAGLPADQAVKVIPKQELVTIGAVALIAFTLAGLVAVLVVYVLDDKGDVSVPTLRGLVVLTVVGMAVTLVFARVDAWVYVVVGGWVLATAVLSWIVLAGLPPKLHDKDKRNETDNELLAAVRAYHEANDSLTDLQFARDKVQGPGGPGDSVMAMQIARAERQRALALSRWRRALERWSPSPGREPRPRNRKGGQHR